MSDERGRGAADDGRPRDADEPAGPSTNPPGPDAGAQEPEIGTPEWLLQQLTGGRRVGRRSAERDADRDAAAPAATAAPREEAAAEAAAPASPQAAGTRAPEEAPVSDDGAAGEPAPFDELLASAVPPEEPAAPDVAPQLQMEFPVSFNWNLTPGEGGDPLVEQAPDGGAGILGADGGAAAAAPSAEPVPDASEDAQSAAWESFERPASPRRPVEEPVAEEPVTEAPAFPENPAEQPQTDGLSLFDALIADDSDDDAAAGSDIPVSSSTLPEQDTTPQPGRASSLFEPPLPEPDEAERPADPPPMSEPAAPEPDAAEPPVYRSSLYEPAAPEPDAAEPPVYRSRLYEPPSADPATTEPPADRSSLFEPASPAIDPSTEPEPPTVETPAAAGSWVIPPAEPPQPAEPERPRTIFDPPVAASSSEADDASDERGHGLAALLGFGGPEEPEHSGRSVIGDTTSIIPLVPGAVPPPPATPHTPEPVVEPRSSARAGSHQPDPWLDGPGHREPAALTNPVLPPIDAAALFEPATDTAAHRAAAPELDAALRSESRPASPTLPSEHSLPSADEPPAGADPTAADALQTDAASAWPATAAGLVAAVGSESAVAPEEVEPAVLPAADGDSFEPAPTVAIPTVLPSEPDIPAAEAEVALGGVPSPATSPIDAASIAAAAEPASADADRTADTADDGDADADSDLHDDTADESDGLAQLFGDVAPVYDDTDQNDVDTDDSATDDSDAGDVDEQHSDEAEQEPAAALEGPQLAATMPFVFPPSGAIDDSDEADGIDDPTGTGTGTGTPPAASSLQDAGTAWPPVAGTPAPASADSAPVSADSAPVSAATSPSAAVGPTAAASTAGPTTSGLWATPRNRILFSVAGGLAIVLVLIGLFALGTRIPSLLGAAKPAPAPTAAATPVASASPTPTPVPTVTPKPAAPVGAGTHPWDALGGGECIQPFTSVWAQEFTVVDCAAPHTAQMVYTNVLSADPAAPYPGADALAGQIPGLCTASGVVDLGAAGAYPDLQVIGSFPATEQQWKDGQRSYYCFVNRSGGEPLTSSVAGPGPTG